VHDALANFPNLRHKNPTAWHPSHSNCEQSRRYASSELPAIRRIRTRLFESICNLPNSSICGLISWRLVDVGGGKYRPICVQVTSAPERKLVEIFSTDRADQSFDKWVRQRNVWHSFFLVWLTVLVTLLCADMALSGQDFGGVAVGCSRP